MRTGIGDLPPYPSTYYVNYPNKTLSWQRNFANYQQIDPNVAGDANVLREFHQYDVPNLAKNSSVTNAFTHKEAEHFTDAFDVQRLGGSDEQYYLGDDGHLRVKLGEHRYPRYEVSLQAKDANNDGVPEPVIAINETQQKTITLVRGHIYDFVYATSMIDMTEPVPADRANVQFRLSEVQDGVHGTDSNGDAGTAYLQDITLNTQGSVSRIKVTSSTPDTLYYYGAQISGIGGTINVVDEDANP